MSRKWIIVMVAVMLTVGAVIFVQRSAFSWASPGTGKSPAPGTIFLYPSLSREGAQAEL